jgi:hypothetical protein
MKKTNLWGNDTIAATIVPLDSCRDDKRGMLWRKFTGEQCSAARLCSPDREWNDSY